MFADDSGLTDPVVGAAQLFSSALGFAALVPLAAHAVSWYANRKKMGLRAHVDLVNAMSLEETMRSQIAQRTTNLPTVLHNFISFVGARVAQDIESHPQQYLRHVIVIPSECAGT